MIIYFARPISPSRVEVRYHDHKGHHRVKLLSWAEAAAEFRTPGCRVVFK